MVDDVAEPSASASSEDGDGAGRAVVVLGASNVARGWHSLVETIHTLDRAPTDIFAAAGHGRSYGLSSRVLVRELPGIIECGLWRALDQYAGNVTAALVTDVGNDLLYEQSVDQIEHWVETCVERLREHTDRVSMTLLPEVSHHSIGRARFLFFRTLFVPACRLSLDEMVARAAALNEALTALAGRCGIHLIEHDPIWYSLDPIHVVRRARHTAWSRMLSPVLGVSGTMAGDPAGEGHRSPDASRGLPVRARHRGRLRAARRRMCGREQYTPQPCARLADGGAVNWY